MAYSYLFAWPSLRARHLIFATIGGVLLFGGAATGSYAFAAKAGKLWEDYKQRFMISGGRIINAHERVASHSEGRGYGMLFSGAFNDQSSFDRLWNWTANALRRSQDALFFWRYLNNSVPLVSDHNNATDGDLLIALALTSAAKKWQRPHLLTQAKQIYLSIRKKLLVDFNGRLVPLPSLSDFPSPAKPTLNMSYYIVPFMRAAQELDDAEIWTKAIDHGVALIRQARFGRWGLPRDWASLHIQSLLRMRLYAFREDHLNSRAETLS